MVDFDDAERAALASLTRLTSLKADACALDATATGSACPGLSGLLSLELLHARAMDDAGLAAIVAACPALQRLSLHGLQVRTSSVAWTCLRVDLRYVHMHALHAALHIAMPCVSA